MIMTRLEDDTIRVNVIPRKLNESENAALTTPLSVAGTAEDLDAQLPSALIQFVGAHLELRNTLESAKDHMATAAKAAKAEARSKAASKTAPARTEPTRHEPAVIEPNKPTAEPSKSAEPRKQEPTRNAGLFDPTPVRTEAGFPASASEDDDEEEEILAEGGEETEAPEGDDFDEAA